MFCYLLPFPLIIRVWLYPFIVCLKCIGIFTAIDVPSISAACTTLPTFKMLAITACVSFKSVSRLATSRIVVIIPLNVTFHRISRFTPHNILIPIRTGWILTEKSYFVMFMQGTLNAQTKNGYDQKKQTRNYPPILLKNTSKPSISA